MGRERERDVSLHGSRIGVNRLPWHAGKHLVSPQVGRPAGWDRGSPRGQLTGCVVFKWGLTLSRTYVPVEIILFRSASEPPSASPSKPKISLTIKRLETTNKKRKKKSEASTTNHNPTPQHFSDHFCYPAMSRLVTTAWLLTAVIADSQDFKTSISKHHQHHPSLVSL